MAYYVVSRRYSTTETVIVKANSVFQAFQRAGDDIYCDIKSMSEGDYEPDYQSIKEVAYVSEDTQKRIDNYES